MDYVYDYSVFFGFCLIWALGGFNIGQKNGGRLTKISPARQTHFWEFCWPALRVTYIFGKSTPSEK